MVIDKFQVKWLKPGNDEGYVMVRITSGDKKYDFRSDDPLVIEEMRQNMKDFDRSL